MDDASRMNQIMNMDTRALLSTIKDLESKLSQYQRQDVVPAWATSLLPRLDKLEEGLRNANLSEAVPDDARPQSREELSRDDRLLSRVKAELYTHAESTSLVMEAKVAAMGAELERLHKLLQIRPTTSEYQKIMFIVNDQGSQMKHDMQDIESKLMGTVHSHLSTEITSIMNGIKSSEGLNDRSIDGILKRIEQLSKDYYDLKVSTHTDYEQLTADLRVQAADISGLQTAVAADKATTRSDVLRVNSVLTEHADTAAALQASLDGVHKELHDAMRQLEIKVKNDSNEMTHDMRRLSDRLEFKIKDVHLHSESVQKQVEEQRMQSIIKNNELASSICAVNENLDSNRVQQNQVLAMLEKLHEFDASSKIVALTERLDGTNGALETLTQRADDINDFVARVDLQSADLKEEVAENKKKTSGRFDEVYNAVEECQRAIEVGSNDASMLSDALLEVKSSLTELSNLRTELDYVKQINSGSLETVNMLQERVEGLDAMLKYVSDSTATAERTAMAQFEELSNKVQDTLIDSQAEMEARIEQIQEQMESAADMGSRPAAKPRGRKKSIAGSVQRVEEYSDDESDGPRERRRSSNTSSATSGRAGRGGRQRGKKQSVAYPVEGAPAVVPSSPPSDGPKVRAGSGGSSHIARRTSSRGVLLGSAGTASRERKSQAAQRVPPTILDSGEFGKTPPESREGQRQPAAGGDVMQPNSESPSHRASVRAPVSNNYTPPANVVSTPKSTPSSGAGMSKIQNEFFGESSAAQFETVAPEPNTRPEGSVPQIDERSSDYQSTSQPPVEGQRNEMAAFEIPPEPQTHSTNSPKQDDNPRNSNQGDGGPVISMGQGIKRQESSQDAVSLAGSDSLNSTTSKKIVNPKVGAVSAGSVSVQSSSSRHVVSGFTGGASGNAGYSSAFRYEPNQSSVTLQTNSLLKPKSRPASAYSEDIPFEEKAVHSLLDVAERVFELGLHFEEVAVRRSLVPDISEESCSELAALSITVGETVSKLVDTEAILRILRARPDQPIYGDAFISNRRLRLIDELLEETRKHLEASNPEAGITRLDARDYYMKKVERVMQLSLSKHDQVLLPTQTRAGKVKIPSCIACDRPLLQKVRGDLVTRSEVGGRSQIVPFGSANSQIDRNFSSLDEGSFYGEQDSLMSKSADGQMNMGPLHGKAVGLPSTLPRQPSRGGVETLMKANPLDIGGKGKKDQGYTLLTGFKMPNKKSKLAKYTDDRYLFSDDTSANSGQMNMSGSGAAGYLGSPNSKASK